MFRVPTLENFIDIASLSLKFGFGMLGLTFPSSLPSRRVTSFETVRLPLVRRPEFP